MGLSGTDRGLVGVVPSLLAGWFGVGWGVCSFPGSVFPALLPLLPRAPVCLFVCSGLFVSVVFVCSFVRSGLFVSVVFVCLLVGLSDCFVCRGQGSWLELTFPETIPYAPVQG